MGAFLATVRKTVDEKRRRTTLKRGESRYCFGGCGARRVPGKLVCSRLTGTNMCMDCLLPDMLDRPEKYHYFVEHWQVNQAALWLFTTMHEALIFSCLFFNDLTDEKDESCRFDGYHRWYRTEIALEDRYIRCCDHDDHIEHTMICECRKVFYDALSGRHKDKQLRRYVWFDGPGAGFVTFDDVRYAMEDLMTSVATEDLQLPTAEMVTNHSSKLLTSTSTSTSTHRAQDSDSASNISKSPGVWHFMEPEVIDQKLTQSCMDVLHDCYLQQGRIEDFEACKDVFASRAQLYWKAERAEFLHKIPWAATYLKTL